VSSDDWRQAAASLTDILHSSFSPLPLSVIRVFVTMLSNELPENDAFCEVLMPVMLSQSYLNMGSFDLSITGSMMLLSEHLMLSKLLLFLSQLSSSVLMFLMSIFCQHISLEFTLIFSYFDHFIVCFLKSLEVK